MRFRSTLVVVLALALLAQPAAPPAAADGTWLDTNPPNWNSPGMVVPVAPAFRPSGGPPCGSQERPAEIYEDSLVAGAGWHLFGSYVGGWNVTIVRGLSGYDGMCRPLGYQSFVFVDGVFAGTLSPEPMDSRADGAQSTQNLLSADEIVANFLRYKPSDALCCPSATSTVVYRITRGAAGPVVERTNVTTSPNQ